MTDLPSTERPGPQGVVMTIGLDEATRPSAPAIPGATEQDRAAGRQLAAIHAAYLAELDALEGLLSAVERGDASAGAVSAAVDSLTLERNYRQFGTLCGRQCYVLTMHHTIEERHMFPAISARAAPGLLAVIERLQAEHVVVHQLLERLSEASLALGAQAGPAEFAATRDTFRALLKVVRSHFRYEETELAEAIGVYDAL
ncbi:hemerythrin domain-containing protein [Roseibium aestuarii]|uniref:Hemerythrin domain-containing protein n=1 Tax=Roseibium aestuarii TaxID=2600299 RepID=A0ABW4JXQ6_9HYPH|nr:hemerythrin domain-containing protein [Roseibium aestuarii]